MTDDVAHQIRWSSFKILISLILIGLAIADIYFSVNPLIEGDYSLKSFVNLSFAIIIIFFTFGIFKLKKNYEWVFWACGFGLIIFCSMMFVNYESLF